MKPTSIITACAVVAVVACNFHASAQVKKTASAKKATATAAKPKVSMASVQDITEGKALISKSDCLSCHSVENKLVGPAYKSICEKYPLTQENIAGLSQKIISGGSGVWGPVPMAPHPAITTEEAGKMVKYILTLNAQSAPKAP